MDKINKKTWGKRLMKWGILAFILLGTYPVLLFLMQRKMVYFPRRYDFEPRAALPKGARELEFMTSAGKQVCFYLPPKAGDDTTPTHLWILFGGNASLALDWLNFVNRYPERSHAFLLVDYPGYGLCKGSPCLASIAESSEKAYEEWKRLAGKGNAEIKIGTLGHSLGAAAALIFAAKHQEVGVIILAAPFTSLIDMAKMRAGALLSNLLLDRYDNRARLNEIAARQNPPVIHIFHGREDTVVPFAMGYELAQRHKRVITFHEFKETYHDSILTEAENSIWNIMSGRE